MERIHYLYKITNTENNKIYIGQSVNTRKRWYDHKRQAAQSNPTMFITRAIKKYGNHNFDFEVIACVKGQNNADETEKILIKQYNSTNKDIGYNLKTGGDSSPVIELSKEQSDKLCKSYKEENSTLKELAMFYDLDHRTIRRILTENNIKINSHGKYRIIDGRHIWI